MHLIWSSNSFLKRKWARYPLFVINSWQGVFSRLMIDGTNSFTITKLQPLIFSAEREKKWTFYFQLISLHTPLQLSVLVALLFLLGHFFAPKNLLLFGRCLLLAKQILALDAQPSIFSPYLWGIAPSTSQLQRNFCPQKALFKDRY